jgi:hypothetical protein
MLSVLEPVIHSVAVTGHRIAHGSIWVPRECASLDAEESIIAPWFVASSLIVLIEHLNNVVGPFRTVDAWKTYKHDIHVICGIREPGVKERGDVLQMSLEKRVFR